MSSSRECAPRVFVVQQSLRSGVDGLEHVYDLSPARAHGELVYLLSPSARPFKPDACVAEMRSKLSDYRSGVDSLLLVGNPALIGFACAITADVANGRITVLQWDGRRREYRAIRVDLRWSDSIRFQLDEKRE